MSKKIHLIVPLETVPRVSNVEQKLRSGMSRSVAQSYLHAEDNLVTTHTTSDDLHIMFQRRVHS
jgi:hypothetical protein